MVNTARTKRVGTLSIAIARVDVAPVVAVMPAPPTVDDANVHAKLLMTLSPFDVEVLTPSLYQSTASCEYSKLMFITDAVEDPANESRSTALEGTSVLPVNVSLVPAISELSYTIVVVATAGVKYVTELVATADFAADEN